MGPVLCLITDRRRTASDAALVACVAAAARAGVHLVQVRERDLDGGRLLHLVQRCVYAVEGTTTRIIVNERIDVAIAAGAHGVHLRGDSPPASRVRTVVPPGFLVGRSVHGVDDARRATGDGSDYLLFGTVFETSSKPGMAPAGVSALATVVAATAVPVLAVGGITVERVASVARAGAAGVAAIGLFANLEPQHVGAIVAAVTGAFDTVRTGP